MPNMPNKYRIVCFILQFERIAQVNSFGKDDNGIVVGVDDYKKLMDEIPNKIKNNMGITAEANLLQERTARNDLLELANKQILKRIGEANQARYVLV